MRAWSLHCAVVARHGHRNQAHHNGTGLCCEVSSAHVRECLSCWRAHCGLAGAPYRLLKISYRRRTRAHTFLRHCDRRGGVVPTSTVVMSQRDDLQMRILDRRLCGAKLVNQSASIEVFATLQFSCARQTSFSRPSRPCFRTDSSPLNCYDLASLVTVLLFPRPVDSYLTAIAQAHDTPTPCVSRTRLRLCDAFLF